MNAPGAPDYSKKDRRFILFSRLTLALLFLLILAGGIVRSSGAGMGCPDWPKCFGRWIPPLEASQLPANYQEIYSHRGYESTEFNAVKTWTEYINRLIGAITGFFVLLTAVFSWHYRKTDKQIFLMAVSAVLLVGFQAWLGGKVVESNLKAYIVTMHMLVALLIVALMIYLSFKAQYPQGIVNDSGGFSWYFAVCCLALTVIQIAGGTQVRELIDEVSLLTGGNRDQWIGMLGADFEFHRDFSIVVLLANIAMVVILRRRFLTGSAVHHIAWYIAGITVLQIITGMILSYFALPPVFQTVHLLLASILFSVQFYLILYINPSDKQADKTAPAI